MTAVRFTIGDFRRFLDKVDATGECWLWTGTPGGRYGSFWLAGRYELAHRVSHLVFRGDPGALQVDHLCFNRRCVHPSHLEAVDPQTNTRRERLRRRACPHGHAYDEANIAHRPTAHGGVQRVCRACDRERARARRAQA